MPTHPMITRAKAGIFKPLERMNYHVTTTSPLPCSHVYALRDPNWKKLYGSLSRYKARLVQTDGVNSKLDVKNAFLHGHLSETIYMHQPPGFVDPNIPNYHSKIDSSLYVFHRGSDIAYLLLYVDDIILTTSSSAFLQRIITSLHKEILERAHMQHCNLCKTPVDTESKLGSDGNLLSDPTLYCSLAGALYAYYAISTSGYCVLLGDNLLSWSAKRQVTLSRSSAEAKYRGVANVVAETAWIRNLLLELHAPLTTATLVYCDNISAVYLSTNLVQHQRTKHIEIDIHFVQDYVASG
ncbi:ribonuclease H-like domain-containing protein [Tanacetum coccineum]